ncbi:MAG: serine hydrolase domain-containing protein [Ignavibacteria bacterium]|nr:serine hydrolase domain-containing protein [Ignavibacteria bacterium]
MNKRYAIVIFLTLLASALFAQSQPASAVDAQREVDKIFARWNSSETPGCAIAVSRNGQVVLSRAYGMADLEHGIPNSPETVFEAGSVSKQFTAAAIVLLAQQGKLGLDDEVRKYIPELPDYGCSITLRHLLNHTSGLRDWGTVVEVAGWPRGTRIHRHADVLDVVSRQRSLNFPSGSEYSYCNTGYNLLAMIVERVSGEAFANFTKKNIFDPLGMKHTSWRDDFTRIVRGRAIAYSRREDSYSMNMPFENVHGNGGLLTTVGDLLLWNENFIHGKVGGPSLVEELQRRGVLTSGQKISYAEGLRMTTYRNAPEVSHSGSTAGYRAFLVRYPKQHLSVALLCNLAAMNPDSLAHQTADMFLSDYASERNPEVISLPLNALKARAGLYRNPRLDTPLRLSLRDGRLYVGRSELLPLSDMDFLVGNGPNRILFSTRGQGNRFSFSFATSEDTTQFEPAEEVSPTVAQLQELEGLFHSEEVEVTYSVLVQDGKLSLRRRPDAVRLLTPTYRDTYVAQSVRSGFGESGEWVVRFRRDQDGHVVSLSIRLPRAYDLLFARLAR